MTAGTDSSDESDGSDNEDHSVSGERKSAGWKPPNNKVGSNSEPYIEVHSEDEYKQAFERIGM